MIKIAIGLVLGLAIGFGCSLGHIPSPAPPVLDGALLVLSMTIGWTLTDRWFAHRPKLNEALCAGPTGTPAGKARVPAAKARTKTRKVRS